MAEKRAGETAEGSPGPGLRVKALWQVGGPLQTLPEPEFLTCPGRLEQRPTEKGFSQE